MSNFANGFMDALRGVAKGVDRVATDPALMFWMLLYVLMLVVIF